MKTPPRTRLQRYLESQTFTPPSQSEHPSSPVDKVLNCLLSSCFSQCSVFVFGSNVLQPAASDRFHRQIPNLSKRHQSFSISPNSLQLFSYEVVSTQQRVFLALNEAEFSHDYEFGSESDSISSENNPLCHAYEIIREHSPCKLYMDVEVGSIPSKFELVHV